jgi:hypothetical protein
VRGRHFVLASTISASLLAVLGACGSFSGSDASETDGGTDAVTGTEGSALDALLEATEGDAGHVPCATRTDRPLMCADFDDVPTALVYSDGVASDVQVLANRTISGPGKSAPNAMWSDARTSTVPQLTAKVEKVTTHVRVALDVFVEPDGAGSPMDGALLRVGIAPDQCYVEVRILSGSVLLQTQCLYTDDASDFYRSTEILANPIRSASWVRVELDVDYAAATATATIDGSVRPPLGLNPHAKPGGKPFVDVGINLDKVRVGFDNVLAIAD